MRIALVILGVLLLLKWLAIIVIVLVVAFVVGAFVGGWLVRRSKPRSPHGGPRPHLYDQDLET